MCVVANDGKVHKRSARVATKPIRRTRDFLLAGPL